ncbi:MAG TPA: AraC family transcriptional regulator [Puia sp.]|nr:AraC family transcriptional regulator [Puia sp.]
MKPLNLSLDSLRTDAEPRTGPGYFFLERLPVGLTVASYRETSEWLDITVPPFGEQGLVLVLLSYKGELQIVLGSGKDLIQPVSPGLALLSAGDKPLIFRSVTPVVFSAVILFIPRTWIADFMSGNDNFWKIEQLLQKDPNIVTCRLGRRQLSLFSSMLTYEPGSGSGLLEIQNAALSLLEYFCCNRHRSLLGATSSEAIGNEDDLSLIREVESYISEYYCSDTFTVDSILKKTYTSYHKLNFLFKSMHGMTISEYIRNKRIEKSKEMIADNAKSISQIAYEIGYSSISNYILAFKKIYQITPGKYKKQLSA